MSVDSEVSSLSGHYSIEVTFHRDDEEDCASNSVIPSLKDKKEEPKKIFFNPRTILAKRSQSGPRELITLDRRFRGRSRSPIKLPEVKRSQSVSRTKKTLDRKRRSRSRSPITLAEVLTNQESRLRGRIRIVSRSARLSHDSSDEEETDDPLRQHFRGKRFRKKRSRGGRHSKTLRKGGHGGKPHIGPRLSPDRADRWPNDLFLEEARKKTRADKNRQQERKVKKEPWNDLQAITAYRAGSASDYGGGHGEKPHKGPRLSPDRVERWPNDRFLEEAHNGTKADKNGIQNRKDEREFWNELHPRTTQRTVSAPDYVDLSKAPRSPEYYVIVSTPEGTPEREVLQSELYAIGR